MANRRDPLRAPTETSANRQCPPRKETRWPSGRCVHRAARSRTYCRPDKREGLKKTRATTSKAFWAAGNRRAGACADSRLHCLAGPHETQRRNRDGCVNHKCEKGELQSGGIALEDDASHGSLKFERLPEIAVRELPEVAVVLHVQRQIQAKGVAQLRHLARSCALSQHLLYGIARHNVNHQKYEREHQPERGKGQKNSFEYVSRHS